MARMVDGNKLNLVGENVKRARLAAHMSQKELADKLETMAVYVYHGSISRIENGDRTVTDVELWGSS